jgi:hypothetical protein
MYIYFALTFSELKLISVGYVKELYKRGHLIAVIAVLLGFLLLASSASGELLRIHGSKDLRAPDVYTHYQHSFDPAVIPSDSITFNPAIIFWDGIEYKLSADSQNADMKKHLRAWYEPAHEYKGSLGVFGPHPTILIESTYILVESANKNPVSGSPGATTFILPLAEIPTQPGLGTFDADADGVVDLLSLVFVKGDTPPFWKTTDGTIRFEKMYEFKVSDSVRFLDHTLTLESVDQDLIGNPLCQVNVTYIGNMDDDTTETVLLHNGNNYFDRHNNQNGSASHPDRTWYARPIAVNRLGEDVKCKLVIGKELKAGDTFYVNSHRYDVPAIEVIDSDGDRQADKLMYITLRTPICKGDGSIIDESVVTTQEINCTDANEAIPVNPPFNQQFWNMVDDVNIPEVGDAYAETADEHIIDSRYDEVSERIIRQVDKLDFRYFAEDRERRYHTNLLERLKEKFVKIAPPLSGWEVFHVQTEPSNYTEFRLPQLPDIDDPANESGDYLVTLSFIAPNSGSFWHEVKGFAGINKLRAAPRVAFAYDRSDRHDIYVNNNTVVGNVTVRIYGEDNKAPLRVYSEYQQPFDPSSIPKDSVTFNPAIINFSAEFRFSGDSSNSDLKKFLRMWYEPGKIFKGPRKSEGPHPTIVLESTYMLVGSTKKEPVIGSAGSMTLAFPLAEVPGQIGLGTFDADGDGLADLVKVAKVEGATPVPFWKTTRGTVAFEKLFELQPGGSIRFLDHALTLESVDEDLVGNPLCQVNITYVGNVNDHTVRSVLLGGSTTYFNRHNLELSAPKHPEATWYARAVAVSKTGERPIRCKLVIGKELKAGDTFYTEGLRYDVAAVEVVDADGDRKADKFGYITVRTSICKKIDDNSDTIRDNSVVTTQWIVCIPKGEPLPLNPPFNEQHDIVDDIDLPEINSTGGPADMFADFKLEHLINMSFDEERERILRNQIPLNITWINESKEPRYHTNLLEVLGEKWRGNKGLEPLAVWDWFHVQTMPDQYTEFILPKDELNLGPLHNDYLITTSWYALNSLLYDHGIAGPAKLGGKKIPRVSFVYDGNTSTGLYINE